MDTQALIPSCRLGKRAHGQKCQYTTRLNDQVSVGSGQVIELPGNPEQQEPCEQDSSYKCHGPRNSGLEQSMHYGIVGVGTQQQSVGVEPVSNDGGVP